MNILKKACRFLLNRPPTFPVTQSKNLSLVGNNHKNFIPNVYGMELSKHIFPNNKKTMSLSEDEVKFYRKFSRNYVVVLIKRVLDKALEESNEQQAPFDKFYDICTYCKIKYFPNNGVELQGLYRVKIQNIQEIIKTDEMTESPLLTNEKEENVEEEEEQVDESEEDQEEEPVNQGDMSIQDLIKKSRPQQRKVKREKYYSLKVKRISQPPLIMNYHLQIKFQYLVQTYRNIHQAVYSASYPSTFNYHDFKVMLDYFINEISEIHSDRAEIQRCLEIVDYEERMDMIQKLMQKTMHVSASLVEIEKQAKFSLRNKKFYEYYSEIIKITKQVLDGKKTKQMFIEKSIKSFNDQDPPKEVREVFKQELEKYEQMDENSMEAGVIKSYIEQLSKIPYNVKSEELFDLQYAASVLDEDHYGMKDAKNAILEIIAVGKLKKTLKGKIFCFVGGPGLGKTTFAKSIAKALNRKFYNISLGGVTDSSVLKGHRRTYIGAYSGKIIEALKQCQSNNPVILLDEIDKMGSSYQGDPRSELLQILDPNQNNSFIDNFVDVPVDLSNVLFITSANYEHNISKPLIDRMEKIKLTSYTKAEKIQIFNRHLLRRALEKTGIKSDQFHLPPQVVETLVEEYSLGEPGVRYLEKNALIILEKIAYKIVTGEEALPIEINKQNLNKYVGNSYFRRRDHTKIKKGVAISLGGGNYGGRLTYIEAFKKSYANRKDHKRGLLFTGSLGDVFKEAMNISYTYARNFLQHDRKNHFLFENEVHIHAPEGASKKDGSTDSLTIACALVSLAQQKRVKPGIALTGELTLHGKVLRTHGIKEKIIVAKREKIKEVIIPIDNLPDIEMLSEELKEDIKFHFVRSFSEVYPLIFPQSQDASQKIAMTM